MNGNESDPPESTDGGQRGSTRDAQPGSSGDGRPGSAGNAGPGSADDARSGSSATSRGRHAGPPTDPSASDADWAADQTTIMPIPPAAGQPTGQPGGQQQWPGGPPTPGQPPPGWPGGRGQRAGAPAPGQSGQQPPPWQAVPGQPPAPAPAHNGAPAVQKAERGLALLQHGSPKPIELTFSEEEVNAYLREVVKTNAGCGVSNPAVKLMAKNYGSVSFEFNPQQFLDWQPRWRGRAARVLKLLPVGKKTILVEFRISTESRRLTLSPHSLTGWRPRVGARRPSPRREGEYDPARLRRRRRLARPERRAPDRVRIQESLNDRNGEGRAQGQHRRADRRAGLHGRARDSRGRQLLLRPQVRRDDHSGAGGRPAAAGRRT